MQIYYLMPLVKETYMTKDFKSGFVAIIGRPNVGKSTLLNQFLKQKVVIVSPKAQTTRNKIQGIYTDDEAQIIFIDTPGVHKAKTELGKVMNEFASSSIAGVDAVIFIVEANKKIGAGDEFIISELLKAKIPTILVANKVDLVANQQELEENMNSYKEAFPFISGIAISATNNYLVDDLLYHIIRKCANTFFDFFAKNSNFFVFSLYYFFIHHIQPTVLIKNTPRKMVRIHKSVEISNICPASS